MVQVDNDIHNSDQLKFRKSTYAGHLICVNPDCDYVRRAAHRNEMLWSGCTTFPFVVGDSPPNESTIVCKVCRHPPVCLDICDARIYYSYSMNPTMSRAAIHFGDHTHSVAKGMYRDSTAKIEGLIADQVASTPTATNSAIALSASKDFLSN